MTASNLARTHMINGQIITGNVIDEQVLHALKSVDKTQFVPEKLKKTAYIDEDLPLGGGRYILEPLIFARMLKYAGITKQETVLDIGCCTGYSSAVISRLAQKVIAQEEDAGLAAKAKSLLASYTNVEVTQSPLAMGAASLAPYHVILVEGAIGALPPTLADQIYDGGRLLAIEHEQAPKTAGSGLGKLVEYKKIHGELYRTMLHDANAYLLPGFKKPEGFVF